MPWSGSCVKRSTQGDPWGDERHHLTSSQITDLRAWALAWAIDIGAQLLAEDTPDDT